MLSLPFDVYTRHAYLSKLSHRLPKFQLSLMEEKHAAFQNELTFLKFL